MDRYSRGTYRAHLTMGLGPTCGLNADSRRISPEGLFPEEAPNQRILLWTRGELNP